MTKKRLIAIGIIACHIDLSVIEFDEGEAWYEPPECPGVVLWQDGIG